MQRCPKCGRTYENDTQKFCTHDGGRLAPDTQAAGGQAQTAYDLNQTVRTDPFDPEATVQRMPDLNKTVASMPTSEIRSKDTGPATQPPPVAPSQPPTPAQGPTVMFDQSQQPPPSPAPPQQQQYYQPPPPAQPPQGQPPQVQHPPVQPPPYAPQPPAEQQYAQPPAQQYAPQHAQAPQPTLPPARRKSSRAPLIIGIVVILLLGGAAAWYFLIYKKGETAANSNSNAANTNTSANTNTTANANTGAGDNANVSANANTNVSEPPPPPNSTKFVNSQDNLDPALADKFSDFSFYYPNTWERDPKAGANNFIRVERRLPPDFTQENFTVSWYKSKGTFEADSEGVFSQAVELAKSKLKNYPEFKVVSEGDTTVNGIKGHEFRFQSVSRGTEKGDITLWGRVIFLPPGKEGETNGVQLLMLTTSLAPEIKSADDVGVKGELPTILNSFRMGSR